MNELKGIGLTVYVYLAAAWLLALPAATQASTELTAYTADYKVKISLLSGMLHTDVKRTETGFAARSVIKPTGLANLFLNGVIEEYSEFTVGENGVRPQHYESVDTLSSDHKRMVFDFDYDNNVVTGLINDAEFRFELDGPVHDRVSIQYELMHNLLNDESSGDYALLDGDELKQLTVTNIGRRKVRVPFGEFEAVGIQHRQGDSSRISTLWCVEKLGFLPVVIEQHRNGKLRVRAVLENYTPGNAAEATAAPAASAR